MKTTNGRNSFLLQLSGVIFFIIVWMLISYVGQDNLVLFLASPQETIISSVSLLRHQGLIVDIVATLTRTVLAFLPAVFFGVIFGFLLGSQKILLDVSEPLIEFFRSLPATALLPIFILAFGINDMARIGAAIFIGFWVMVINTIYGVTHVSKIRTKVALSMKANRLQIFKYVTMWEILPYIFSGMRLTVSISLVIIVITEMVIGPTYGLGIRLLESQQTFKVGNLYAIMIATGALGFMLNKTILFFERRIIHWTQA